MVSRLLIERLALNKEILSQYETAQVSIFWKKYYYSRSPRLNTASQDYLLEHETNNALYYPCSLSKKVSYLKDWMNEGRCLESNLFTKIDSNLKRIEEYVKLRVKGVHHTFLTLSYDQSESTQLIKHVHYPIQSDPDRCIVWSFCIPLHVQKGAASDHCFFWSAQENLYPKTTYVSINRMRKIERNFSKLILPVDQVTSLYFDASRTVHYTNNTKGMYLWFVFEGVDLNANNVDHFQDLRVQGHPDL